MTDSMEILTNALAHRVARTRPARAALQRADHWTDAAGKKHAIASMSPRYCATVIRFLERRAELLHDGECAEWFFLPEPNGEQASWDFDDESYRLHAADPVQWLHDQPLLVALRERAGDAKAGPSPGWLARHPVIAARRVARRLA